MSMRGLCALAAGVLLLSAACSEPTDYDDSIYPDPGNSGTLVLSDVQESALVLSWGAAIDEQTAQDRLEYRAVHSTRDDIGTAGAVADASSPLLDWTEDTTSVPVSGLAADSTYYFNVAVRDHDGNMSAYVMTERPVQVQDTLPPTAGSSGTILPVQVHKTDVVLEWVPATDNATASGDLSYKLVRSSSSDIGTVADAQANGTLVQDWSKDYTSWTADGLTMGTTYWFNVLVQDAAGNRTAYQMMEVETFQPYVYWSDSTFERMMRADLDGDTVETVISYDDLAAYGATDLDLNPVTGKLYWARYGPSQIYRSNPDGSYLELFLDSTDGVNTPIGLTIDSARGIIYWVDQGLDSIRRSWLNDSGSEAVVTGLTGGPFGLALDPEGEKLYWTDWGDDTVKRADLNGTLQETLLDNPGEGIDSPYGIDLDLDAGKIYVSHGVDARVVRCNLDGSGFEVVVTGGTGHRYFGVSVSPSDGMLYWSDTETAQVCRVPLGVTGITHDNAQVEVVVSGVNTVPEFLHVLDF